MSRGVFLMLAMIVLLAAFTTAAQFSTDEYTVSIDKLDERLEPGDAFTADVTVTGKQAASIELKFSIEGNITERTELGKERMTISSGQQEPLPLTLYAPDSTSTLEGYLIIKGTTTEKIPLRMSVRSIEDSNIGTIMIDLKLLQDRVTNGNSLNYVLDMYNLIADREYNLTLSYSIQRLDDENITTEVPMWNASELLVMKNSLSILKEYKIPKDYPMGDYALTITVLYEGYTSLVKGLFIVERPLYAKKVGGILPVWTLVSLLSFVVIAYFVYSFIRQQQEKKKRFHVKVDYKLIPTEGERSIFIGYIAETKHKCYLDMDNLTVHSIVAGSTGGGKSIAAQDIVEECLLKGASVAVFDPTAQWSGMLRKLQDKKFLALYPNFNMDPKKDPKAFPGNIKAIKDHREIVDIFKYLKNPGEIQVFTTNTLDPKNYDTFVANMIRQIFHSKLDEFRGLKYLVVFDEIHRILPKFGGSGEGFTQIERGCREFRKWGIGIVLISQVLSDFVGEIKANINTQVQMKTRDDGDLNRIKMQYGEEFIQGLVKAPVGSGMVQNAAYNKGQPFYVTFRPILHSVVRLTDDELDEYNKYNLIVEQLEYEFEQLETEKQDVFDLKLELKLAKDKIKSGNFNMVKIYLEGLTPRVQKFWEKLGKQAKKLEIKLIDEKALKAEYEAAKKAKAEYDKQNNQNQETPKEAPKTEVQLTPEQLKDNQNAIEKLFKSIQDSISTKDWFAINDRIMELQAIPLPPKEKTELNLKIQQTQEQIEQAKKPQPPPTQTPPATQTAAQPPIENKPAQASEQSLSTQAPQPAAAEVKNGNAT